jgi:hypothetical protein
MLDAIHVRHTPPKKACRHGLNLLLPNAVDTTDAPELAPVYDLVLADGKAVHLIAAAP